MNLIQTSDVAELTGRSVPTVARWVKEGKLTPALKGTGIRGAMWFRREDVNALLASLPDDGEATEASA